MLPHHGRRWVLLATRDAPLITAIVGSNPDNDSKTFKTI